MEAEAEPEVELEPMLIEPWPDISILRGKSCLELLLYSGVIDLEMGVVL